MRDETGTLITVQDGTPELRDARELGAVHVFCSRYRISQNGFGLLAGHGESAVLGCTYTYHFYMRAQFSGDICLWRWFQATLRALPLPRGPGGGGMGPSILSPHSLLPLRICCLREGEATMGGVWVELWEFSLTIPVPLLPTHSWVLTALVAGKLLGDVVPCAPEGRKPCVLKPLDFFFYCVPWHPKLSTMASPSILLDS